MTAQLTSDPLLSDLDSKARAAWSAVKHTPLPSATDLRPHDPILSRKMSSGVTARRARFTKVVKVVLCMGVALCLVALGQLAFASDAEDPVTDAKASAGAQTSSNQTLRGLELDAARAPKARGAVKHTVPARTVASRR